MFSGAGNFEIGQQAFILLGEGECVNNDEQGIPYLESIDVDNADELKDICIELETCIAVEFHEPLS